MNKVLTAGERKRFELIENGLKIEDIKTMILLSTKVQIL